ncbi:ABC transporter substrate-binding protein [Staphylococcus auricularis]|uniref:ABC transporter substrate-binding protein n=1 Tax=Staphylococcus auricularis TaxID=29379 RepID=UPI003F7B175A
MALKIKIGAGIVLCLILLFFSYFGLGASTDKVVISTNADEEAVEAMENALDSHGFKGEYVMQPQATAELGGKMMAEGKNIEADIITQATYYLESAQQENEMFASIPSKNTQKTIDEYPDYITPILGNMGSLFVNTKALDKQDLPEPKTVKDLTKPEYKNQVAFPNIMDSSTGWLVIQSILGEYGNEEGRQIIEGLIENAGPHVESSGSGPLEKVEAEEVAVGIGLRAQAVESEQKGNPIHYIDPREGNYSLVEAAAVVDKDNDEKQQKAQQMVETIQQYARKDLLDLYPVPLYKGEKVDQSQQPDYPKKWDKRLTVDLLEKHQDIFNDAKKKVENK